ncbi:uncharacterized protein LOC141659929 [Apium graveolens]|uniref:uncharacterized protein LOC141659929 n=1 Tax=Apium graveolens TaxID=4045 RepID=UPI003D7B8FEE
MADIWKPTMGINIKELEQGIFLFQFFHKEDKAWVQNGGPWTFDSAMLCLDVIPAREDPLKVSLWFLNIWIQVHDFPAGFMSESVGIQLGNFFGEFIMYDAKNNSSIWRECMRLRIKIDVRKPLKRRKKITRKNGQDFVITCKYERLGDFCFICGLVSHTERFCRKNIDNRVGERGNDWGAWLRGPLRMAAGQGMSKWLREEGDTDWEERIGRENSKPRYTGGNFAKKDKEGVDLRDLRISEYGKSTNSVTTSNQQGVSGIPHNLLISNIDGPEEEEAIGLSTEGRKRSRTGHESKSTMDTDGVLQLKGFAAIENTNIEATLSNNDCINELCKILGFSNSYAVDRIGHGGGLAIMWKRSIICRVVGASSNHINIEMLEKNAPAWRITCFYGYPERSRRRGSWDFIRSLAALSHLPWCIFGDFNDLMYASDKMGNNSYPQYLLEGFRASIEDCNLIEIDLEGGQFIWEKSRGTTRWVRERLDRAFVSLTWRQKFLLCLNSRMFGCWRRIFIQRCLSFWGSLIASHILPKLVSVSSFMSKWGRRVFHKFRDKVKLQKKIIDDLINRSDAEGVSKYFEEKEKLNVLLLQEETYWKLRAKNFWLAKGDSNTKFFHAQASTRKRVNHISYLINDAGEMVDVHEDMCDMVKAYYKNMFADPAVTRDFQQRVCEGTVSLEHNAHLVADLSFEEFEISVKQMHPDKASGPDGLNPAFYQHFWGLLGKDIFKCCKRWLEECSFPAELNDTNFVLIPKKDVVEIMVDLRPIALCNVLYKILAKVLANRLKVILPDIISENQSAFVPGRNITDNVLLAFELIHYMKQKRGGVEGDVALKLDISKAYDRVDWRYLKYRLSEMGFDERFIRWIMLCVSTVQYSVCFNGSTIGPITPKRGLRQGDPLSPYLFLVCVKGLSKEITKAETEGSIRGCKISSTAPAITHLLFTDDNFLWASREFSKVGCIFSANVRTDKQQELENILGVYNGLGDGKYLGLPSLIGRSKKSVFNFLKDRVEKRIQGWGNKLLSKGGKMVLIKCVAQAIPSFCMSCFKISKTLCQAIERLMNRYWWRLSDNINKGINWLAWDKMGVTKSKERLGFRSLHEFNLALLGKERGRFEYIWSGIWEAKEVVKKGFSWVIGDGRSINAHSDPWLRAKQGFCVEDYQLSSSRSEKVCYYFCPNTKEWDEEKVRQSFHKTDVTMILNMRVPQYNSMDRLVWTASNDGYYSAKSGYYYWQSMNDTISQEHQLNGWNKLWRLSLPHKVKIFLWRFCKNTIPVRDLLRHKGVEVPSLCHVCSLDVEHMLHVFFDCNFASQCWQEIGLVFDMMEIESASSWMLNNLETNTHESLVTITNVLWGIWFGRNKKLWEGKYLSPSAVVELNARQITEWKNAVRPVVGSRQGKRSSSGRGQIVRWSCPIEGQLKLNVDASVFSGANFFFIGMVIRDHNGHFLKGKVAKLSGCVSIFEAEAVGVQEALTWLREWPSQQLEVGTILESCKAGLMEKNNVKVGHVKNLANRAAHQMARIPCSLNSYKVFESPPNSLLEIIVSDSLEF